MVVVFGGDSIVESRVVCIGTQRHIQNHMEELLDMKLQIGVVRDVFCKWASSEPPSVHLPYSDRHLLFCFFRNIF